MPELLSRVTVGRLKEDLEEYKDSDEIIFGSGNLTFYRVERRGHGLAQIELNENTLQIQK